MLYVEFRDVGMIWQIAQLHVVLDARFNQSNGFCDEGHNTIET